MAVRAAPTRRYLVLDLGALPQALESLESQEGWRLDPGAPTSRDRIVLAAGIAEPAELQLIGVANEPVRREVAAMLRGMRPAPRIVVNPAWFV